MRTSSSLSGGANEAAGAAKISPLTLGVTGLYLLAWPAVLLLGLGGDWRWIEGWLFALWFVALCGGCIAWLYRRDPALLAERYRKTGTGGQSRGDAFVVRGLFVGFFLSWIVVAPARRARRFGWTPKIPVGVEGIGGAMLVASAFFFFRSFADNTFLSPLVRSAEPSGGSRSWSTGVYCALRAAPDAVSSGRA